MTTDEAIEPLRLSFEVACLPEHAFLRSVTFT